MTTIGSRARWPFPTAKGIGVSAEEIKVQQPKVDKDPAASPMPQRAPTEFLSPSSSSEHLRLATPIAANPLATPTGPLHDHIHIRQAVAKSRSDVSRKLYQVVANNGVSLSDDRRGQIRASLAREQALFTLLGDVLDMQQMIYGRIIGGAEA